MEKLTYTCPDCGKVEVLNTSEIPDDEMLNLDQVFEDWMVGMGWERVSHGFLKLSKKWVCGRCKCRYH